VSEARPGRSPQWCLTALSEVASVAVAMYGSKMDLYSGGANGHPVMDNSGRVSSSVQQYTSKYIRRSRAVAVLWGAFTICSAVLAAVAFFSPHWVGDTDESSGPGHFGLWRFCTVLKASNSATSPTGDAAISAATSGAPDGDVVCLGDVQDFASILSPAFRASTIFVGLSVLVLALCVVAFVLFCFMRSQSVFELCGTMQILAGE